MIFDASAKRKFLQDFFPKFFFGFFRWEVSLGKEHPNRYEARKRNEKLLGSGFFCFTTTTAKKGSHVLGVSGFWVNLLQKKRAGRSGRRNDYLLSFERLWLYTFIAHKFFQKDLESNQHFMICWFDPISNHWQTCPMGLRHMGEFALSLLQYGAQFLSQHAGELGIDLKTSLEKPKMRKDVGEKHPEILGNQNLSDEQKKPNHLCN